jgi:MarR family transcriptional regulator, lower aerobic nicotinate degradation pathway regulator
VRPPVLLVTPTILDRWCDQLDCRQLIAFDPNFRHLPTWLLSQAAHRSHRLLHDRLAAAGSTPYEYRILSALEAVGDAPQADLGRLAMLDRRDVALTVRALVESGAVTRQRSPDDARLQIVSFTTAGRQRYERLHDVMRQIQGEVFAPLAPNDREQLTDYLIRLTT